MKTQTKFFTGIGIAAVLVLALVIGGWFINIAFAQRPWHGGSMGMAHNNQAVLDLLKSNESELWQQRQQGKSWLDIATSKGVSEQALTNALLQPMTQMIAWMTQNYPQQNTAQMTEGMRQQFAQDIRVAQYRTMTDMHVFDDSMMNAPHNGAMINGNNVMGGMMNGGMMGGWNSTPNVNATPVPSTQKIDREIQLVAQNSKFDPPRVEVKKGETIKFTITNQDNFAHNAVSQEGKLAYAVLPANQTTSIVWVAPNQAGTFTVICTWHPGMQIAVEVKS